jgi:hypothetical protein
MLAPALTPTKIDFYRWRCWASDLRDGDGPFAEDARIVVQLLDTAEKLVKAHAANLADELWASVEMLVGRMLRSGAKGPDLPNYGPSPLRDAYPVWRAFQDARSRRT